MRRLFFAVTPNDTDRARLARVAAAIDWGNGRRVASENLHLTLLFVGDVDDRTVARLCSAADSIAGCGFALYLDASGWWRRGGIVWLAPTTIPLALLHLVEQLREHVAALALPLDARPYRPHVTICRRAPAAPAVSPAGARWLLDKFSLLESISAAAGVHYVAVRDWSLKPSREADTRQKFS